MASPTVAAAAPDVADRHGRRARLLSGARSVRLPRVRWLLVGAGAVFALYALYCGLRLAEAAHRLQLGVAAVEGTRSQLNSADLTNASAARDASAGLQRSARDFAQAHSEVNSPWLGPLHVLPFVNRQVESIDAMSGAAATVTTAGSHSLSQVQALLDQPHHQPAQRATLARQLSSDIGSLSATIDKVDLGPTDALLPVLASKRNTFAQDLAQVQTVLNRTNGAAAAAADLLTGQRTYLVLTANNAEMRDGSATALQAGTLSTDDGSLTLSNFQSTQELASPTPLVPITGDLVARWGAMAPNEDYRNLGLSPQFELNAPVAAAMWQAQTGQHVDGVLTVDVVALKDLLAVTGPVSAGGTTIDADNVEQYLFVTQYDGVTTDAANSARRDELGQLASAVFTALQQRDVSGGQLVKALAEAVNGRHILAWSSQPAIEADWTAAGANGQLGPNDLLLGTINKGVNKLDPYQQIDAHLTTTPAGGDTRVTITATLHNHTPSGLPSYAAGGAVANSPVGYYTGALSLDVPKYAGDVRATGGDGVVAVGADGPSNVLAESVKVPPGGSATVTWTFLLVGHHGSLQVDPSARVPAVEWSTPGATFTDATTHTVSW